MSNTERSASQEVCVLFAEAVAWIAYRNLNGAVEPAVGPRLLKELPRFGDDDDEIEFRADISIGREQLAQELLLDYAAKGKIRIYAKEGSTPDGADVASPLQLTTDFIIRAEFEFDVYQGATLFIREEQGYNDLAVNYGDLLREFWGDAAPPTAIRKANARSAPGEQAEAAAADLPGLAIGAHLRHEVLPAGNHDIAARGTPPLRRRGPRSRYPWPNFVAELVRFAIAEPGIDRQAALERHMLEWCATTWDAEPSASEVRYWVSPTFQILRKLSAAVWRPNGAAGNLSPVIAEAARE
jgi:hypothetical protein